MVGVPRSSGCRICVQRRVRCDGARPVCNNCKKGNRPCPGYGPGVKFQDEGPKLREKYQKRNNVAEDEDDNTTTTTFFNNTSTTTISDGDSLSLVSTPSTVMSGGGPKTPQQWNILGADILLDAMSAKSRMNLFGFVEGKTKTYTELSLFDYLYSSPSPSNMEDQTFLGIPQNAFNMFISPVLSPSVQQNQLLSNFTSAITPPESKFLPKAMRAQSTWLSQIPDFTGAHQLLDSAVRAVTLVHIGRIHKNESFVMESRPYYGKALQLLAVALNDYEKGMDNRTLCATILLSFYEMFASSDDASWVRHAGGAGMLMRMRGPKRHRYGFDRDIFLAYRHTLVIEAMANDVPSFLDEPEWRQVTKQIHNDLISNGQIPPNRIQIFDMVEQFFSEMAAISTISAKACHLTQKMRDYTVEDSDDPYGVYHGLVAQHEALMDVFEKWKVVVSTIGHEPPLEPTGDPVIPCQYKYSNVFIASFYVGFWTTTMLVNSNTYYLAKELGFGTQALEAQNEEFAMECCQSVDFMIQSSFLGPFFTIFALRFALRVFKLGTIRSDWALCKLIEIGDRRMLFAKGRVNSGPSGVAERPEVFYEGAKQRLAEYALQQQLLNGNDRLIV